MATSTTLDVIAARYSCRAFKDTPIETDVLDAIVTAGLHAPSAMNRQPWRLIAVRDPAVVAEIEAAGMDNFKKTDPVAYNRAMERGGTMMYHAPVVLIIAGALDGQSRFVDNDCGIVASHIALAAASLGVDSCIAANPRTVFIGPAGVRLGRLVGMPAGFGFNLCVYLGYSADDPKPGHEIDRAKATVV